MVALADVVALQPAERARLTAKQVLRNDAPTAAPWWTLRQALRTMEEADVDRLAVIDGERLVGVVTTSEVMRLDEILGETEA